MSDTVKQHEGFTDAVNLTVSLCLTYTLCIACVRLWIRKGAFGADDLVIAIATVLTLGHTASSYAAIANGLGKPSSILEAKTSLKPLSDASIAGVVLFIVAMYASKVAVLTFLARITKNKLQILAYRACATVVLAFGFMSVLIATVGCSSDSGYYWVFHDNQSTCPTQSVRWQVVTALDIITELLLLVLPVQLVWDLQMPRRKKATIITAFYLRLPVIGLSIGRNFFTLQLRLPHKDAGLDSALVVIWMEIELAYALAASTLSALKAFTESFNSGFGLGFTRGKGDGSYDLSDVSGKSGQSSRTEKLKDGSTLESASSGSRIRSPVPDSNKDNVDVSVKSLSPGGSHLEHPALRLRPEHEVNSVTRVSAEPASGESSWHHDNSCNGSESSGDDMVILRETEYSVQHDRAPMLRYESIRV